jgi:hypothetical protein
MNAFKKTIVAASIAAATLFGANASADEFNQFTVSPGGSYSNFAADKITGNYSEIATFNDNGTFNVSLLWNAAGFATSGGSVALDGRETGLGAAYGLYAVYKASGTVGVDTAGRTTFNFLPGSGFLQMYLDQGAITRNGGTPASGSGNFTLTGNETDVLLASGNPLSGQGTLDPNLNTCTNPATGGQGINCGSFGSKTSLTLTGPGSNFFIAPNPFYNLSFQSGQLNNFTPTGTVAINGSLDVVFSNAAEVPEPASVGLLGLGMLGLYAARRRNKKAA